MEIFERLFVVILLVAITSSVAQVAAWEILGVDLHRDDGSGRPGELVPVFHPGDRDQYLVVRFKSLKPGVIKPATTFTAVATAGGNDRKIAETTGGIMPLSETYVGKVSLPEDFPLGSYRFDLKLNGEDAVSRIYWVMGRAETLEVRAFSLHLADAQGRIGPKVGALRSADRHIFARIATTGVPPGSKVTWRWTAVKTAAGAEIRVAEATREISSAGVFVLTPDLALPRGLPAGTYRLDFAVDGKTKGSFPFKVGSSATAVALRPGSEARRT